MASTSDISLISPTRDSIRDIKSLSFDTYVLQDEERRIGEDKREGRDEKVHMYRMETVDRLTSPL